MVCSQIFSLAKRIFIDLEKPYYQISIFVKIIFHPNQIMLISKKDLITVTYYLHQWSHYIKIVGKK